MFALFLKSTRNSQSADILFSYNQYIILYYNMYKLTNEYINYSIVNTKVPSDGPVHTGFL